MNKKSSKILKKYMWKRSSKTFKNHKIQKDLLFPVHSPKEFFLHFWKPI